MAFEWPDTLQLTTKQRIASILWTLQRQPGGEITDESGFATNALNDACKKTRVRQVPKTAPAVYSNLLANISGEREGSPWMTNALIEREIQGKRTYAIRLLLEDDDMPDPELAWTAANMPPEIAEAWYSDEQLTDGNVGDLDVVDVDVNDGTEVTDIDVAVPTVMQIPDVELDDPGMVAGGLPTTMLGRVLTISNLATELMINLAARESEPGKHDQQLRDQLAWALDENERIRRAMSTAEDDARQLRELVQAKDAEIKALRQSLRITGANLETLRANAMKNGHDDDERQRQVLANLMRERSAVPVATNDPN